MKQPYSAALHGAPVDRGCGIAGQSCPNCPSRQESECVEIAADSAEIATLGYSARVSGAATSLADETAPQTSGSAVNIAAAAGEALAVAALRVGFALMTIAAASDTVFALIDGGGLLAGFEGVVLVGLAISGLLRPAAAARLLRPPGRVVRLSRSRWKFVAAVGCDGYTVTGMRVSSLLAV